MKRELEIRILVPILFLIGLGCFLFYAGLEDRGFPSTLITRGGPFDLSPYFQAPFPNAFYGPMFAAFFLLLHFYLRVGWPEADPCILPAVALLSGLGLILILRLSPELAFQRNEVIQSILERHPGAPVRDNVLALARLGRKHFSFLALGCLVLAAVLYELNQKRLSWLASKKYCWVLCSVLLIGVTLIFGKKINHRSLWMFGFQTIELVKLLLILFLAGYVYDRGQGLVLSGQSNFRSWISYAGPFMAMWTFALLPVLIQKDLGPVLVLASLFLVMFFIAGNRKLITLLFLTAITLTVLVSYTTGFPDVVRERIDMMLDPFGRNETMARALWSIAQGGLLGTGIGYGEPYRIPEVQSDFTFAAVCEEMGFVGGAVLILGFVALISRFFKIAAATDHLYKKTLVLGIAVLMSLEAIIIIAGNLGKFPLTGITLPLVSYGGSSLVVHFLMVGIVLKISAEPGSAPRLKKIDEEGSDHD